MRKVFFFFAVVSMALMNAQRPLVTKWYGNSITFRTVGSGTYSWQKALDPTVIGSGAFSTGKTTLSFPSYDSYIVSFKPSGIFRFIFDDSTVTKNITEISQWGDISWAPSLASMFIGCSSLTITATDVPDFSQVTDMSSLFNFCSSITSIPNSNQWNTGSVTNMNQMFYFAQKFNSPIGNWNVSRVNNMEQMFNNAVSFNQSIGNWDVSHVASFSFMFNNASSFNQDISKWNIIASTNIGQMFSNASSFNQNLGSWSFNPNYVFARGFLDNSGLSCTNYGLSLKGWAQNPQQASLTYGMGAANLVYGGVGKQYRDILVNQKGWVINGDFYDASCDASLSTNEIKLTDIKVQNPVKDFLTIQSQQKINGLEIYDTAGRLVKSFKSAGGNVSDLAKGVYIVKISTESGTTTQKIIKE